MNFKDPVVAILLSFLVLIIAIYTQGLSWSILGGKAGLYLIAMTTFLFLVPLLFSVILYFALRKFTNISKIFKAILIIVVFLLAALLVPAYQQIAVSKGNPFDQTPNAIASNAVRSMINETGLPVILENVTFNPGDTLFNKTITELSLVLSAEQVCVNVSPLTPNYESFEKIELNGTVVRYGGNFSQQTRLLVICDRANELVNSLDEFAYVDKFDLDFSSCDLDTSNRLCYVSIIPND